VSVPVCGPWQGAQTPATATCCRRVYEEAAHMHSPETQAGSAMLVNLYVKMYSARESACPLQVLHCLLTAHLRA
jgi:hypothetical protein